MLHFVQTHFIVPCPFLRGMVWRVSCGGKSVEGRPRKRICRFADAAKLHSSCRLLGCLATWGLLADRNHYSITAIAKGNCEQSVQHTFSTRLQ
ncbi:hypothetical protein LZ32DRAFT_363017 [Colletotrichum eremochloae]|nr:hypothetical protein LZ32DRAFT_363017 [Colletotrichum eremochloae]